MIDRLVLLGATGDLAGRFLLPALVRLHAGQLSDGLRLVGAAAQHWDDETFASHVAARLQEHAGDVPAAAHRALLRSARYRSVDLDDHRSVGRVVADAAGAEGSPVAVYLALPPGLFPATARALVASGLPPGSRIAVEKPFGDDLDSAVSLNALLARASASAGAGAGAVFRVDHALALPAAQHLLALRASGGALGAVWDGGSVEQVDVLWEETLALEGRADFYDRTGAVKDVLQNHLLQVLTLVAMDLPATHDERELHAAKLDLLRSLRPLSAADVRARTRRARYTAGRLAGTDAAPGAAVPDYAREPGVDPARRTETYAELVLAVDRPRWAGTTFVLRAGKALAAPRKGVRLYWREGAGPSGGQGGADATASGLLSIDLDDPPGRGELAAYEAVLTDVLSGGSALSVSADEAEQSWRVVQPVLQAWARGDVPLLEYPAGSHGPPSVAGIRRADAQP